METALGATRRENLVQNEQTIRTLDTPCLL